MYSITLHYIILYYIILYYTIWYIYIYIISYICIYIYTHIITIYKLLYVFAQSEHTVKHYTMPPNFPRSQLPESSRSPLCPNHLPPRMVRSFTAKKHVLKPLEIGIEQQKRNLYEQPKVDSTWLTNKIQGVIWCFFQPTCWDFSNPKGNPATNTAKNEITEERHKKLSPSCSSKRAQRCRMVRW